MRCTFSDKNVSLVRADILALGISLRSALKGETAAVNTRLNSALKGEFAAINAKLDSMHECTTDRDASLLSLLNDMKDEMLALKNEISGVKNEMGIKSEMSGVRNKMAGLNVEYRRFDARVHNWQAACHNIKVYREGRTTMSFAPFKIEGEPWHRPPFVYPKCRRTLCARDQRWRRSAQVNVPHQPTQCGQVDTNGDQLTGDDPE